MSVRHPMLRVLDFIIAACEPNTQVAFPTAPAEPSGTLPKSWHAAAPNYSRTYLGRDPTALSYRGKTPSRPHRAWHELLAGRRPCVFHRSPEHQAVCLASSPSTLAGIRRLPTTRTRPTASPLHILPGHHRTIRKSLNS